jgi:hypothetical protein
VPAPQERSKVCERDERSDGFLRGGDEVVVARAVDAGGAEADLALPRP